MRICPISVAHARNYQNYRNYNVKNRNVQPPNFKGWGGALGTIVGAGAGVLLTAVSGGALAWTIPALSGAGAIGGDICGQGDKPSSDDFDLDSYSPSYRDY